MDKKTLIFAGIIALLVGCFVALWVYRVSIIPAIEARHTDQGLQGVDDSVDNIRTRMEISDSRTKTEVKVIHETVRAKVQTMPPADIARSLNDELARFRARGVERSSGGVDNTGAGLLRKR
jgi:hypothetical protein